MRRILSWVAGGLLVAGLIHAAEINDLSTTDASNTARFPENMAPSAVNDGARALEGLIARWHKDNNGSVSSTGSSGTYAVSANQTISALYHGLRISFTANHSSTGAATLNVDSTGAKAIRAVTDTDLSTSDIRAGQIVDVVYDSTNGVWQMVSPRGVSVAGPTSSTDGHLASFSGSSGALLQGTGITSTSVQLVGKRTIWIPAGALISRSSTGAAITTTELSSNLVMVKALAFDGATDEFAQFQIAAPPSWDESTLTAQFHWHANSSSGTVQWYIQCVAVSDGDALDASFGTAQGVTDTMLDANDNHLSPETSALTCAGTPAENDLLVFQVYRDADVDSHAADANLLGIKLFMTTSEQNDQ